VNEFHHSLWYHTTPRIPAAAVLRGTESADVAVIGAGVTGLSTAVHLAEAGARVVVLEAAEIGSGASGRNGGFVVPHLARGDPDTIVAQYGESGERLVKLVGRSAQALFDLISRLRIDCDARQGGWFQPAHSKRALATIEQRALQWAARGEPVTVQDAAETERLTGCAGYLGSWCNATGGTIHPLKFVHGLALAASRCGALVFSRSAVVQMRRSGAHWRLTTGEGELQSQQVVVCTNAVSCSLLPRLAAMVVPMKIFQAASEPVSPEWREHLLRQGQSLSDTRINLFTYRFDADWRLITGALPTWGLGTSERLATQMALRLQNMLRLPTQPHMQFVWHGQASLSPEFLPCLVEVDTGVISGTACNGRGLALSAQMGRVLAEGMRSGSWRDSAIPMRALRPVRLRRFIRWGVRCYPIYGSVRDRLEQLNTK